MKDFESLNSTKFGRFVEHIIREYWVRVLGYSVVKDLDINYDTSRDIDLSRCGKQLSMEIKGDKAKSSPRLPIEIQQQNRLGVLVDSGYRTTKADKMTIYCQRYDTAYVINVVKIKSFIDKGLINEYDIVECNTKSKTGKTKCYMIDIDLFKEEGFFEEIYTNVYKTLKDRGLNVKLEEEF